MSVLNPYSAQTWPSVAFPSAIFNINLLQNFGIAASFFANSSKNTILIWTNFFCLLEIEPALQWGRTKENETKTPNRF